MWLSDELLHLVLMNHSNPACSKVILKWNDKLSHVELSIGIKNLNQT